MAGLPEKFRKSGEQAIATFDFFDVATGTGFKTFQCVDLIAASGTKKILTTTLIFGDNGITQFNSNPTDLDFDLDFEVPITLKGNCLINIQASSSSTFDTTLTVTLFHVDSDSNETQIGTPIGHLLSFADSATYVSLIYPIPLKHFKAGETFRMNLSTPDITGDLRWFHDPRNRLTLTGAGTLISAQLPVTLPIKLNF